jgi:hypothetical protein
MSCPESLTFQTIEAPVHNSHAFRKFIADPGCVLALLLYLFCTPISPALADEWRFPNVERVVAVSDIHGAYDSMVETLKAADVVNDDLAWSGDETHLVITGDMIDRGPGSRRAMDFIMRLEQEALHAGGQVHLLLGNHEVMNIVGDVRYVTDVEYTEFLNDESAVERALWFEEYRRSQPEDAGEAVSRTRFNERAPPGYFGQRRAYRYDGQYGQWLLEKPLMIVINDTAFVHGGLPPYVAKHGLQGVNKALKMDLRRYALALATLEDARVLSPVIRFFEHSKFLSTKIVSEQLDSELVTAAQTIIDLINSPLHGPAGPLWYRGTSTCNALIEEDGLSVALEVIGAKRVVIGHTTTPARQVQQRMNGRVVEIDTGILKSEYEGSGHALVIEHGAITVIGEDGTTGISPIVPARRVGYQSGAIDDDKLEDILATGTVLDTASHETEGHPVRVEADGIIVMATFSPLPREKGFVPELAAYRLDRMLGLNMVPATVLREISGKAGTLQFASPGAISERQRAVARKGRGAACALDRQWDAMYVFDVLIHSAARKPQALLYDQESWQLMLIDHADSFSRNKDRPTHLKGIELSISNRWRSALLELSDEILVKSLGDVLDKRRLTALAARRDGLISDSSR